MYLHSVDTLGRAATDGRQQVKREPFADQFTVHPFVVAIPRQPLSKFFVLRLHGLQWCSPASSQLKACFQDL